MCGRRVGKICQCDIPQCIEPYQEPREAQANVEQVKRSKLELDSSLSLVSVKTVSKPVAVSDDRCQELSI